MPSLRQLLWNPIQTHTAMLAGSFGIDFDNRSSSSFSLERQRINELTPTRVSNAFIHARLGSLAKQEETYPSHPAWVCSV